MLSNLAAWLKPAPPLAEDEQPILLDAINTIDPLIKTVSRFERKLAPAARHALDYCAGLADAIPGPIAINTRAYAADPLVHAFFPTRDDINIMLGRSREVRNFLSDPGSSKSDEIFFMLGMRLHEKKILGMALQGEVIHGDVPQRILYFGDHTLREFGHDVSDTRRRLRAAGFYSLARSFATQLDVTRKQRDQWRQERDMESGRASGSNKDSLAQKRKELDEHLRHATESLMPERILDAFAAWLKQPELRLRVEPVTVAVDRMGVIADPLAHDSQFNKLNFHELIFPELISRDRRRWISIVARIQREEALAAIEQHLQATRYIII